MNLPVTLTSGDDYHQAVAGQSPVDALAVDDTLIESDPPDALRGQAGDDRVYLWHDRTTAYGGAGRDRLHGGAGADVMIGGAGSDVAHYDDATKGAVLDLLDASMNAGAALGDVLTGVENVHGTDLADTISGDGEDNMLFDRGADVISDFDVASDILAFHGVSVTDVSRIGADTIVRYDSGGTVTLEAVLSVQSDLAMIFALSDLAA
ncbi:hypothetical protein AL036_09415 [Salipiger aestuarii]|uniref:calcium-binding protein n=1 Tax=Salipiger aestuarii TaxID=568098 RepID=UPI001238A672|nr:hypothetical protein [Salipiger aestuarii]KAA8607840.1 hypothetical protein AL036_09415 [Salipiger aestuarii]